MMKPGGLKGFNKIGCTKQYEMRQMYLFIYSFIFTCIS